MVVIIVNPGESARVIDVPNDLGSLQYEVGGNIEAIYPFDDPVALICNEDGKNLGLPMNRELRDSETNVIYDIISGLFLIVGIYYDDFTDIPEELIEKYLAEYRCPRMFRINMETDDINVAEIDPDDGHVYLLDERGNRIKEV